MQLPRVRAGSAAGPSCGRRRSGGLALAVLLCTAACGGSPAGGAPAGPTPPPTVESPTPEPPTGVQVTDPQGAVVDLVHVEVPAADALPRAPRTPVRSLEFAGGEDPTLSVLAVAPDGRVLVAPIDHSSYDAGASTLVAPAQVALWADEGLEQLAGTESLVPGDPYRQVIGGVFADDAVVWAETSSTDVSVSDWRMFRDGLDGAGPRLLARSEEVRPADDPPLVIGGPVLAAVADRVGWHVAYAWPDGTFQTEVVSVPVAGGELRTESEHAALTAGTDDGWVTERVDATAGVEATDAMRRPIGLDHVQPGGLTRPLVRFDPGDEDWSVSAIAADGNVYAWEMDDDVLVSLLDGSASYRLSHAPGQTVLPEGLAVCGEWVAWSVLDGEVVSSYVLDLGSGEVSVLAAGNTAGSISCGGDYVAWTEVAFEGDREVRAVNLARLG